MHIVQTSFSRGYLTCQVYYFMNTGIIIKVTYYIRKGDLHNYMQFVLTLNECVNYTTAGNVSYVYEPYTIFRIIVSFFQLPQTINLKLCVAR